MSWKKPRVYVLECEGRFKIGKTTDMDKRLGAIQSSCPFPVHLLMTIEGTDGATLERQLHQKYKGQRIKGEWFKLSVAQVVHLSKQYKVKVTPRFVEQFERSKESQPHPDFTIRMAFEEVS